MSPGSFNGGTCLEFQHLYPEAQIWVQEQSKSKMRFCHKQIITNTQVGKHEKEYNIFHSTQYFSVSRYRKKTIHFQHSCSIWHQLTPCHLQGLRYVLSSMSTKLNSTRFFSYQPSSPIDLPDFISFPNPSDQGK